MEDILSGVVNLLVCAVQLIMGMLHIVFHSIGCVFEALCGVLRKTSCPEIRRSQRRCLSTLLAGIVCIVLLFAVGGHVPFEVSMVILVVGLVFLTVAGYLGNQAEALVKRRRADNDSY